MFLWSLVGAEADEGSLLTLMRRACASADAWGGRLRHLVLGIAVAQADLAAAEREFLQALDGFRSLGERWGQALALDRWPAWPRSR